MLQNLEVSFSGLVVHVRIDLELKQMVSRVWNVFYDVLCPHHAESALRTHL